MRLVRFVFDTGAPMAGYGVIATAGLIVAEIVQVWPVAVVAGLAALVLFRMGWEQSRDARR
jgi:hypothetical protein